MATNWPKPAEGSWTEHYPELGTGPISFRDSISPEFYALEREALLHLPLPEAATEAQWRDLTQAWLQAQAREHFAQRLAHFAAKLGVAPPRLRLSSAKGRWGSASSSGVVSLNWRLMHFSPVLIDYVVAHEVAHLREMNHGPDFWALVGTLQPGYETAREALKRAQLPGF